MLEQCYLVVSWTLSRDWAAFNTACITNNPHHRTTAKVYTHFCQENDPTKPYVKHECVGMDWYQERNGSAYICTALAPYN